MVCILDTTSRPPLLFLIDMSHPKPASHLATCHTTLHWDFRQLRKNKHSLNDQRDSKAILSRACSLRGPRKNYPEITEKQQHSQAILWPAQSSSRPLQRVTGWPSGLLGRRSEKPRFPLRGTRGWGPAPWLFPALVSGEITAKSSPGPFYTQPSFTGA